MGTQGIYETRTSLLRKYLPPIENNEMWQIKRFKKVYKTRNILECSGMIMIYFVQVSPHVSSFRSESARKSALEYHDLDGASRFGYFSQGINATPPY